jgi:hypothetical protein
MKTPRTSKAIKLKANLPTLRKLMKHHRIDVQHLLSRSLSAVSIGSQLYSEKGHYSPHVQRQITIN